MSADLYLSFISLGSVTCEGQLCLVLIPRGRMLLTPFLKHLMVNRRLLYMQEENPHVFSISIVSIHL